jgi:hypothetical protein
MGPTRSPIEWGRFSILRVVVMNPTALGTNTVCAAEGQQQFIRLTNLSSGYGKLFPEG